MHKSGIYEDYEQLSCKIIKYTTSAQNYVIYEIEFYNKKLNTSWIWEGRYSELKKFHHHLKEYYQTKNTNYKKLFRFPGKGLLQDTSSKEFLDKRKDGLEKFINACLSNAAICQLQIVQEFILKTKQGSSARQSRAQTSIVQQSKKLFKNDEDDNFQQQQFLVQQKEKKEIIEEQQEYEYKEQVPSAKKAQEISKKKQEEQNQLNEILQLQKEINKNFETEITLSRTEKKEKKQQTKYEKYDQAKQDRGQSFQPQIIVTKEKDPDISMDTENNDLTWNNFQVMSPLTKVNNQMKLSLQQPRHDNNIENRFSVKQPHQQHSPYLKSNNDYFLSQSQIEKQEKAKLEESSTSSSSKKNQYKYLPQNYDTPPRKTSQIQQIQVLPNYESASKSSQRQSVQNKVHQSQQQESNSKYQNYEPSPALQNTQPLLQNSNTPNTQEREERACCCKIF